MTGPLRGSLAIAVATCRELVRQPTYAALVILTLVAYSLAPQLASFALLGERSLLADFGVSMLLVSSWLLVAFGASSVVRREIEARTTLTVLSTPVTRFGFVAGKFLGVLAALAFAFAIFTLALLLAVRFGPKLSVRDTVDLPVVLAGPLAVALATLIAIAATLWRGAHFASSWMLATFGALLVGTVVVGWFDPSGAPQRFGGGFDPLVLRAALLAFGVVIVLAAFGVAAAVWLGRGATLLLSAAWFVTGLAIGELSPLLRSIAGVVLPDFQVFWAGDLFYRSAPELPFPYLVGALVAASLHALLYLGLGVFALRCKSL